MLSSFFSIIHLFNRPMLKKYLPSKAPDFRGLNRSVSQMELYSPTSSIRSGSRLVGFNYKKKRSGMNSKMSTSSLDLSPGRPFSTSPQPIQVQRKQVQVDKTAQSGKCTLLSALRLLQIIYVTLPKLRCVN